MAGVKDFMNRQYPQVPRQWECEKYDLPCIYLAKKQEERQFLILQQKTNMLRQRYGQCVRIHQNNRNMFCREELVRYFDAYHRLQSTGLEGYMRNSYPKEYGPHHSRSGGVRPDQFYLRRGHPEHHMLPHPRTYEVKHTPAVVYAEAEGVQPDPHRPLVVFETKRQDELNVTIHLPEVMPPDMEGVERFTAAASAAAKAPGDT